MRLVYISSKGLRVIDLVEVEVDEDEVVLWDRFESIVMKTDWLCKVAWKY